MAEKRRFFGGMQSRLLIWFLVLSIIPLAIISLINYYNSSGALRKSRFDSLTAIRSIKKDVIENYFAERFIDAKILAENYLVIESLPLFEDAFHQNGFDGEDYKKVEKKFGKLLLNYKRAYGYYDLFLVDSDGNIVYSVSKEKDLGTNLENGPYADTSLAQAFRNAQRGIIALADYRWYEPSSQQAAFVGARIKSVSGTNIGAVIFQVSTAYIDDVMMERAGMGETGEVYLVGEDKLMRSDSRFEEESTINKRRIDTMAANEALAGQEGTKIIFDYRNEEVLSSYAPIEIKGVKWAIISEIDTAEAFASITVLMNTILLMVFLSLIAVVLISLLISRAITRPLLLVVNRVNEIAKAAGDLTVDVPVTSQDEVGELSRAFNEMMATLKGMVIKILSGSQGVSASSQQLSSAAQQTNASVDQVASAVQQLAKGAQTQAQRVEETTKVMEELSASILQGSKSAQQAAEVSSQASKSAGKGAEAVKEAIAAMDKIDSATSRTSQTITKLKQRSEQITDIVTVINNVADQTNLLALNAAIEAARAGEAGRGFAVVAEEVRKLAENSGKSSTEIGKLIKTTINETEDAVKNMEASTQEISSGKEMITRTGTALEEILSANQNVATMLQQIATSSQQMSSGAEQVVKSVKDVAVIAEQASSSTQQANASTQQMAATMQEMSSSAQALAQMGIDLNAVVSEFKTGEEKKTISPEPQVTRSRTIAPALSQRLTAARKKMAEEKKGGLRKADKTTPRELKQDKDTKEKQV